MRRAFTVAVLLAAGCSGGGGGNGGGSCPDPVIATTNEHAMHFEGGFLQAAGGDLTGYSRATLEAWVRRTGSTTSDRQVLGKGPASAPSFAMYAHQSENIAAGFADPSWASDFAGGTAIPNDGTWTHMAVAWNSSSISFFLDGQVLINTTTLVGPQSESNDALYIGGGLDEGLAGEPWDGDLDEVRLWGVERLAGDILLDMDTMLDGTEPGLLAYWNFEEGSGAAADVSGGCHVARREGDVSFIGSTPF